MVRPKQIHLAGQHRPSVFSGNQQRMIPPHCRVDDDEIRPREIPFVMLAEPPTLDRHIRKLPNRFGKFPRPTANPSQ